MALKENFYDEIFEQEKYWTDLFNDKLLNIYLIKGKDGVKDFYELKKKEIISNVGENRTDFLNNVINQLDNIINEINNMIKKYKNNETIDVEKLVNLFLINQMNNTKVE